MNSAQTLTDLRQAALQALCLGDARAKTQAVFRLARRVAEHPCDTHASIEAPEQGIPGLPPALRLVAPRDVPHRSLGTPTGRAGMIHALAHIEFNAINLALDAMWRFADMPLTYYHQWLGVAREESYHFRMLARRLAAHGVVYGDLPAHDSLWEMTFKTRGDVLHRMALVPRLHEARGLDAAPPVRQKLQSAGDTATAAVIAVIERDEIGHVGIGNHWYRSLCGARGLDPLATYTSLCTQYKAPVLKPPFNLPARRAAGFTEAELQALQDAAKLKTQYFKKS